MLTLIIPIGAPGAGKSTMGQFWQQNFPELQEGNVKFFLTCRDELFARTKREHPDWSLRKTRKHLFNLFVNFRNSVATWHQEHPDDSIVVYLDSANIQEGGRKYMVEEFQPQRVVLVNLKRERDILIQRVQTRENHPTFPSNSEASKQIEIIDKILPNIEYAGDVDLAWDVEGAEIQIVEK